MESKQVFKTYDGVELPTTANIWACWKDGKMRYDKTTPDYPEPIPYKHLDDGAYSFSTREACQLYIDSMNEAKPKPTTINSIEDIGKIYGTGHIIMPPTPTPTNITVSMYNQGGEKIISSEVCEFETGVHDGGLKNDMHQPIFEFTNETGKPITIKEGQRIAWKDGKVKLFGGATPDLHQLLSQFSHAYNIPINTLLEFIVNQKTK